MKDQILIMAMSLVFLVAGTSVRAEENGKEETQNNRMKALEGSKSRWSGQFNLSYSGSSLATPFSSEAPNPGNVQPPPLVTMAGTVSARYRIDDKTTAGLGTGIMTQTPFSGPKNTSISDPYLDVARSYQLGPIKNRADLAITLWTSSQYREDYGYRWGFTALNESYYTFSIGLTAGFVFQLDTNLFASGDYPKFAQTEYDIYTDPYFEYSLSKKVNLRSVIGIGFIHNKSIEDSLTFKRPRSYQTLGVGIAVTDSVFLYPFLQFFPFTGELYSKNTLTGISAIINLL